MALILKLPPTRTAERLLQRMEELNLSIADLSEKVGTTYEHVRSLLRGKSIPSKLMVESFAKALRMDKAELERLATAGTPLLEDLDQGRAVPKSGRAEVLV